MRIIAYAIAAFSIVAHAADIVPYTIETVRVVGTGFIELIGPGKMEINDEVIPYEGVKYVRTENIDAMISVGEKGCMLSYSSEGYTENISVRRQSCDEVVEIITQANK